MSMQWDEESLIRVKNDPAAKKAALEVVILRVKEADKVFRNAGHTATVLENYHLASLTLAIELNVTLAAMQTLKTENEKLKQEVAKLIIPDALPQGFK